MGPSNIIKTYLGSSSSVTSVLNNKMAFARLVESKAHLIPGKFAVDELFFEVPKDYSNPDRGTIQLFARSVSRYEKPTTIISEEERRKKSMKPWFVYLQGGPGFQCSPPQNSPITNAVLEKGYQMLYLDQRGTGLNYLKLFRADSIVKDCEAIRKTLTEDYPTELKSGLFLVNHLVASAFSRTC